MPEQPPDQATGAQARQLVAIVHGRVQGVNFRHHTRVQARALGLAGYVRNLTDGSVQVVAQGDERSLRSLLSWLHRGPMLADVRDVAVTWQDPQEIPGDFEVRY